MNNNLKKFFAVIWVVFLSLTISGNIFAQNNYKNEVQKWREKTETELKSENSWLSLAGLFWLKEGSNTIGSDSSNDIKLPKVTEEKVGVIEFKNGAAKLSVNKDVKAVSDGKPITNLELTSDEKGKPTLIELGDVSFTLIKRENRFGIRVKDKHLRKSNQVF